MSKKPSASDRSTSRPVSTPLARGLKRYCTAQDIDVSDEHFNSLVALMAAAEDRATAALMAGAGLLSFHQYGQIDHWIRSLADDVYGSDEKAQSEKEEALELAGLDNWFYGRQSDLIKAAYALGLATGAKLCGDR